MADLSNHRILAADDHPLIRAGLVSYLETEPGLKVVAEAGNGEEALEKYRELRPDIVLMDLSMPVMDGLAATRAILDEFPDAKVIVLTTYGGDEDIYQALDAGAVGYLVKDMASAEVLNIIRTVRAGRRGIPQPIAAKLAEHTPRIPLTPREAEVLSLVAKRA
jgi:DNA-binding NarL/FixJ family response regulator